MARSSDAPFPLSLVRDRAFQLRQVRRVLLLTLFFIVQSTLLLGVFWHNLLGDLVAGNAPLLFASEDMRLLAERIPSTGTVMAKWLVAMLAVNALVTGALCVWILRRLGNPILAIRRALNEIGDGNLEVRLRSGDAREFSELTVALNRALEEVQGRIHEAQALTRVLDELDEQPAPDEATVRAALADCRDVLAWFDGRSPATGALGDAPRGGAANSDAGGVRRDRWTDRAPARDDDGADAAAAKDGEERDERRERRTDRAPRAGSASDGETRPDGATGAGRDGRRGR